MRQDDSGSSKTGPDKSGARKVRERREYEQITHLRNRDLYAVMPLHRTEGIHVMTHGT